ncbi:hypothetical protein RKD27_006302 [Streptomyces sp. SAI-126]|nr:hypothetical protein [Streptomyces sp. SAI-119]MDH6499704.1 hypothetical protein [Streptomyces sp. SAI-149]
MIAIAAGGEVLAAVAVQRASAPTLIPSLPAAVASP